MPTDDRLLERIGDEIAGDLGSGTSDLRIKRHEQAFVSHVADRGSIKEHRPLVWVSAAAVILVVSVWGVLSLSSPRPLHFEIGPRGVAGVEGAWIEVPSREVRTLSFAGNTELELEGDSSARIDRADMEEVVVELSRGRLRARVEGSGATRWTIRAGPYRVTVMGTVFSVNWEAATSILDVSVDRGIVLVQGGGLSDHGVQLAAGKKLHANGEHVSVSKVSAGDEVADNSESTLDPGSSGPVEAPDAGTAEGDIDIDPALARVVDPDAPTVDRANRTGKRKERLSSVDKEQRTDWTVLCDQRRYREAVEAAEGIGIDELISAASLGDLWCLADAARNVGRMSVAARILKSVRRRFGGSSKAGIAAFLLGRIAVEQQHHPSAGARWFRTYLSETPSGPLAEEALGRLVGALSDMGSSLEAANAARQYLARYPNGSYASLARSVSAR